MRQHRLHMALVHGRGRGEYPRADVGNAGHLKQALDRAVLAPRAMQHREDDIDSLQHSGRQARAIAHGLGQQCGALAAVSDDGQAPVDGVEG